jgi:hypothetical protein
MGLLSALMTVQLTGEMLVVMKVESRVLMWVMQMDEQRDDWLVVMKAKSLVNQKAAQ